LPRRKIAAPEFCLLVCVAVLEWWAWRCFVEPMTGIEPAYSAWEVDSTRLLPSAAVRRDPVVVAEHRY